MGSHHDEQELSSLIIQVQAGDRTAIAAIYDRFAPDIFRFAMTIVGSRDVAEDIASETFLRAWTNLPSFKGDGKQLRAYLYTIARNYALDLIKKSKRTIELTDIHEPLMAQNDTLERSISAEEMRMILRALEQLPAIQREVIILRFMEGLSASETARVLNKSEVNIRVIQCRAIKKLQQILS